MKRYLALLCGAVLAASVLFPGIGEAEGLRIAFVDMNKFAAKSNRHQAVQKKLMQLQAQKSAELENLQKELRQMQRDLQKQGPLLKEDTQAARIKEISVKEIELKLAKQRAENELRNRAREADEMLRDEIVDIIGKLRQQLKLDFVLNGAGLLSAADKYDITDRVVKAYDTAKQAQPRPAPKRSGAK